MIFRELLIFEFFDALHKHLYGVVLCTDSVLVITKFTVSAALILSTRSMHISPFFSAVIFTLLEAGSDVGLHCIATIFVPRGWSVLGTY